TRELNAEDAGKLGGKTRWGITPSDPMGTTVRRIDSGQGGARIVTRTCATWLPSMRPNTREVARAKRVHQRKFDQRFPNLAGIEMQYSWAGHLCLSLNGVSVMGDLGDGVFSACVQNGLGTARGTLSGIGAAELACGTRSDISDYFTEQEPPSRLPPRLFNLIGGNAFLRWKEWRAKSD
ncbi:MAG: FAD-dependent oxidoreductase, partial [Proteobacteria bacterium]|nr:FAD-dependent oxidoreductase [Pseudomonadota bacterium]